MHWGAVLPMVVVVAFAPSGAAHEGDCEVAAHEEGLEAHAGCSSSPHTCFANLQATGAVQSHVLCLDQEKNPCLLKAQAYGKRANVCFVS